MFFFKWWFGPGWMNAFARIPQRVSQLAATLSMGILVGTLFEPWKQITSYSGPHSSMELKMRVFFDNIFARIVGFVIRAGVLVFGILASIFVFIFGLLLALLWPIVPVTPVVLMIMAGLQL